jgi:hypothetical protein
MDRKQDAEEVKWEESNLQSKQSQEHYRGENAANAEVRIRLKPSENHM